MQPNELIGIWRLESRAGKQPASLGLKLALKQFKDDGTIIEAGERLSQFQGLLPESKYRYKGAWRLDEDTLEISGDEGSYKSKVAIQDDILEMTFVTSGGKTVTARHAKVE